MNRLRTPLRGRRAFRATLFMLFLAAFWTLVGGFHGVSTTSAQVSPTDWQPALAQAAAERGMDLMRRALADVRIPPNTPSDMIIRSLHGQLATALNGSRTMGDEKVGLTGNVISIPANTGHSIKLDPAGTSRFNVTISSWGDDIVVKSIGYGGSPNPVARSITMDFSAQAVKPSCFNYAVASRGEVAIDCGIVSGVGGVEATIATATPGLATLAVHNWEFPTVNTAVYARHATGSYVAGAPVQRNIIVPPNANPKFNAGDVVEGILYIKSPNKVEFNGNFTLHGMIVFENAGNSGVNSLELKGSVTQDVLPAGTAFDELRSMTGIAILAPSAAVTISASTDSSFKGNLIAGTLSFRGTGNVKIDNGTVMSLNAGANSIAFSDSANVLFGAAGRKNQPSTGLSYSFFFTPKANTYQQIQP